MLVIVGILVAWGIIAYLIILGGSKSKSEFERKWEDDEQMRYLREYQKKKQGK